MANITVGINENLVVASVTKNDKGTLSIKVKQAEAVDPMAALNAAGSTQFAAAEKDFLIYPPTVTAFGGEADTSANILKKIAEVKDPLNLILSQYMTQKSMKWDIFAGTGIDNTNLLTEIQKQSVLDKIYSNIVDQFTKMITPHIGDGSKKLRWIFIRQSKAKHYPSLRKRFLETYPFVEPMDVPVSKLKFSKFEIDNGLATGDAVAGAQNVTEEERNTVDTLFTQN